MKRSGAVLGGVMAAVLLSVGVTWAADQSMSDPAGAGSDAGMSSASDGSLIPFVAEGAATPQPAAKATVAPPKPGKAAASKAPLADPAYDPPAAKLPAGKGKAKPLASSQETEPAASRTTLPPPPSIEGPPKIINLDVSCAAGCDGPGGPGGPCDGKGACGDGCDKAWTLPQPCGLQAMGITLGGWIDQGYSVNGRRDAADGSNGVQTFNDRDREYLMNQTCLFLKRDVNTQETGLDWGGRIDVVYGTDAYFLQAAGLERTWGQTDRYQVALPQFYLDVGINDWTVRMGHFYTILGYEVCTIPDNFFYSHSYSMQYGEPFTHTGMLFMRKLNDQLSFSAGFHRGNDQFDDHLLGDNSLGFLGGVNWTSKDERLSWAFAVTASEEGPNNNVLIYSVVGKYKLSDHLTYVAQHDYGQSTEPSFAEWYSLNQNLFYKLNETWAAGSRYEIFRDNNGTRVSAPRPGNPHVGPYQGNFQEVTVGLNWKPEKNVIFRPELRWDWFDGANLGAGPAPFSGDRNSQFVFGMDLIVTF